MPAQAVEDLKKDTERAERTAAKRRAGGQTGGLGGGDGSLVGSASGLLPMTVTPESSGQMVPVVKRPGAVYDKATKDMLGLLYDSLFPAP